VLLKYTIAILAGVLTTFIACVTTPETGRKQLIAVSDDQMNAMGEDAWKEVRAQEKTSTNTALTQAVTDIGRRIAAASGKNFNWEFNLFDSKEINAFCLPGGKVGVYTGLLNVAKTNAGLAAVVGHEVAHAVARHSAERVTQTLIVAGVMISIDKAMEDSGRKKMILAGLGLGAQFGVILPYSRFHESEADAIGMNYMAKAGFDPREAPQFWVRMSQLGGQPPEFLSTHPNPASRVAALENQMAKAMEVYERSQKVPTGPI
jgi:metalloendopeptidase OMA1, mitochondrial